MTDDRSFIVVPFQRVGSYVGAQQMMILKDEREAQALLQRLSRHCPGVAMIERQLDRETGDDIDKLVQSFGAVPPDIQTNSNWTMALQ